MATNILKSFFTNDKLFYNLFDKLTGEIKLMGALLLELTKTTDVDKQAELTFQIKSKEKSNDEVVAKLYSELGKNFITPFDREDVHYLATRLDGVSDDIYIASKKIHLYKVDPTTPEIHQLAIIIERLTDLVQSSVSGLQDMKHIKNMLKSIGEINELESRADEVFDSATQKLFDDPDLDAKELLKLREIYNKLESVADKCEDVSNVVEAIIVKYA
jgi:uncharacterized protein